MVFNSSNVHLHCMYGLHTYIVYICTTLTVHASFDMVPWSILSDLQSVETQLASVGNILNSEHDIGTWLNDAHVA